MNNYNNYYNPQPQIKTAEMVLAEIDQAIKDTIQYTSVSKITATLDRLRQAGDIVDVGTGTNRRIIQLSDRYDLSQLKARYAPTLANKPVVFKIPFKVQEGRVDNLRKILLKDLPSSKFDDAEDFLNPYILLEDMKKQDNKLQNWLNFSLSAARKDKRKRKKININSYLNTFKNSWNSILSNRQICFNIEISGGIDAIDMRVFEIDLDSIFNNLIVNSIDSFMLQKNNSNRIIKIIPSANTAVNATFQLYP